MSKVRATKTDYEREVEETERLVRPSPKDKPARTDLQRNTIDDTKDPDIDQDPDFADVAKRAAYRVAKRVLADIQREDGRVKVRNRQTGNITYVNPETLKERSQDFEVVDDEEEDDSLTRPLPDKFEPDEEEIGGEEVEDSPAARLKNLKALLDLRHGTPEDQEDFRVLMDSSVDADDTEIASLVDEDSPFLYWYSTVGELREDLREMLEDEKNPKSRGPQNRVDFLKGLRDKLDANPVLQKHFEALLNSKDKDSRPLKELAPDSFILDWYDTLGDLRKDIRGVLAPKAPADEITKKEEAEGSSEEKDRIDFLKEMKADIASDPANRKQLEDILESKEDSDLLGELFPGSPVAKWYKSVGDLRKDFQDLAHIEPPKVEEPEDAEIAPKEEAEESDDSVNVDVEDDLSEDVTFDEDKSEEKAPSTNPKKPETKSKLKPEAKKRLDDWMSIEGHKDKDFREFAKGMPGVRERDGQIFVWDNDRDSLVPFKDIGETKQWDLKRLFDRSKSKEENLKTLRESVQKDPQLQEVLLELSRPNSALGEKLQGVMKRDPRTVPELANLQLPESINFVEDLFEAAGQLYKQAKPVKQRAVTRDDQVRAVTQLVRAFPPDVVQGLMAQKLHPDDISELIGQYHTVAQSKPKSTEDAIKMVGGTYATSPKNIMVPPKFGKDATGKEVPFAELSPEDQAAAMRIHQIRSVAISLAAREAVVSQLERKSGATPEILGPIADFMLRRPGNETPEQRVLRGQKEARSSFYRSVQSGPWDETDYSRFGGDSKNDSDDIPQPKAKTLEISDTQIRRLLDTLASDPPAQQMMVGALQGFDYHSGKVALEKYGVTEHDSVDKIRGALQILSKSLDKRSKRYPAELRWINDPSYILRQQLLERVRTLAPEKYPELLDWNETFEDERYKQRSEEWDHIFQEKSPYRKQGLQPPPRPVEPLGYSSRHDSSRKRKSRSRELVDEHRRQTADIETAEDQVNQAYREKTANAERYSSYPKHFAMVGRVLKRAVFWGVEDSSKESYPEGHPDSQRDLGSKDFSGLVSAARAWLKTPVLSENVEGLDRDVQVRAALDLALREHNDGQYSAGLLPTEYDMLLGRLGVKQAKIACGDSCTCGGSCSCKSKLSVDFPKEQSMKASSELRLLAKRVASTNPEIAYDIVTISNRVAQQEESQQAAPAQDQKEAGLPPEFLENIKEKKDDSKEEEKKDDGDSQQKQASANAYSTLRSHVIRMASANPNLLAAYKPLLETIKQLGKG